MYCSAQRQEISSNFQGELFSFEIDLANKQDNIDGGVLLFVVQQHFHFC